MLNELEDLTEVLKTKDRMLDDQIVVIGNLKKTIKDLNDEIQKMNDNKVNNRDYYEEKLQAEYDENERLKVKNEELNGRLSEMEEEFERMA